MSLFDLFCQVDDFCRQSVPEWLQLQLTRGAIQRQQAPQLSLSEIMTILIWFHCSHYRTFKAYSTEEVQRYLRAEFPALVSYSRFVELTPTALLPWLAYRQTCLGACTGVSFLDGTALTVCDNPRIAQHHGFSGPGPAGQDLHGLVLGLQIAPVGQRPRRVAQFRLVPREHR